MSKKQHNHLGLVQRLTSTCNLFSTKKKKIEKTFAILNAQRRQEAQPHASVLLKVKFAIAGRLPAAELPLCLTKCGGPAAEIC